MLILGFLIKTDAQNPWIKGIFVRFHTIKTVHLETIIWLIFVIWLAIFSVISSLAVAFSLLPHLSLQKKGTFLSKNSALLFAPRIASMFHMHLFSSSTAHFQNWLIENFSWNKIDNLCVCVCACVCNLGIESFRFHFVACSTNINIDVCQWKCAHRPEAFTFGIEVCKKANEWWLRKKRNGYAI